MAENEVTYKVNIDTADLANQLAAIRSQINNALSDQTFQATVGGTSATPATQNFESIQLPAAISPLANQQLYEYQAAAPIGMPEVEIPPIALASPEYGRVAAQQQAPLLQPAVLEAPATGFNRFSTDVGTIAGTAQYGLQRIGHDIKTNAAALLPTHEITRPSPEELPFTAWKPDFGQQSTVALLLAQLSSVGYDPSMSLTPGAYREKARDAFGYRSLSFGADVGGTALGTIVGSAWGPGGAMLGGAVGGFVGGAGYEAFAQTLGRDYDNMQRIKEYARDTSWRFLSGRFTEEQAGRVGIQASALQRGEAVMGQRLSGADIQRMLEELTEAGGFDFVRSAEEYSAKAKKYIENLRQGMQTLRVPEKAMAEMLVEFERYGLTTTVTPAAFTTQLAASAYNAGYTPAEFRQFAVQSAEMLRGTGISMGTGYAAGPQVLADVRAGMAAGNIEGELVRQLGGPEETASMIQRMGWQYGMSQRGFVDMAAQNRLGADWNIARGGLEEMMRGAIGNFPTPGSILEFRGSMPERLSRMNPEDLLRRQAARILSELEFLQQDRDEQTRERGHLTENKFIAYAQQNFGMSVNQARLAWDLAKTTTGAEDAALFARTQKEIYQAIPDPWDRFVDRTQRFFAEDVLRLPRWATTANEIGTAISQTVRGITGDISYALTGVKEIDNTWASKVIQTPEFQLQLRETQRIQEVITPRLQETIGNFQMIAPMTPLKGVQVPKIPTVSGIEEAIAPDLGTLGMQITPEQTQLQFPGAQAITRLSLSVPDNATASTPFDVLSGVNLKVPAFPQVQQPSLTGLTEQVFIDAAKMQGRDVEQAKQLWQILQSTKPQETPERNVPPITGPAPGGAETAIPLETREFNVERMKEAIGSIEGKYDSVGVPVVRRKYSGFGIGKYQYMTYRDEVRDIVKQKPGGTEFLERADTGEKGAVTKEDVAKFFTPEEQDRLFEQDFAEMFEIARKETDPTTNQPFTGQRLLERVGQMHYGGRETPIDNLITDANRRLTVHRYGEVFAENYRKAGGDISTVPKLSAELVKYQDIVNEKTTYTIDRLKNIAQEDLEELGVKYDATLFADLTPERSQKKLQVEFAKLQTLANREGDKAAAAVLEAVDYSLPAYISLRAGTENLKKIYEPQIAAENQRKLEEATRIAHTAMLAETAAPPPAGSDYVRPRPSEITYEKGIAKLLEGTGITYKPLPPPTQPLAKVSDIYEPDQMVGIAELAKMGLINIPGIENVDLETGLFKGRTTAAVRKDVAAVLDTKATPAQIQNAMSEIFSYPSVLSAETPKTANEKMAEKMTGPEIVKWGETELTKLLHDVEMKVPGAEERLKKAQAIAPQLGSGALSMRLVKAEIGTAGVIKGWGNAYDAASQHELLVSRKTNEEVERIGEEVKTNVSNIVESTLVKPTDFMPSREWRASHPGGWKPGDYHDVENFGFVNRQDLAVAFLSAKDTSEFKATLRSVLQSKPYEYKYTSEQGEDLITQQTQRLEAQRPWLQLEFAKFYDAGMLRVRQDVPTQNKFIGKFFSEVSSKEYKETPENVEDLKKHIAEGTVGQYALTVMAGLPEQQRNARLDRLNMQISSYGGYSAIVDEPAAEGLFGWANSVGKFIMGASEQNKRDTGELYTKLTGKVNVPGDSRREPAREAGTTSTGGSATSDDVHRIITKIDALITAMQQQQQRYGKVTF